MLEKVTFLDHGTDQLVFQSKSKRKVIKVAYSCKILRNLGLPTGHRKWIGRLRSDYNASKKFENSLRIIRHVATYRKDKLDLIFPKIRIVENVRLTLCHSGFKYKYRGVVMKQNFVNFLYNKTPLHLVNKSQIIKIQITLWECGVGLGTAAANWGPKNFGISSDGSLKLVDTSGLTRDFNKIEKHLTKDVIKDRKKQFLRFPEIHDKNEINEYFDFISRHVNQDTLRTKWESFLKV